MGSLFSKSAEFITLHYKNLAIISFVTFGLFLLIASFGEQIIGEWGIDLSTFWTFLETSQQSSGQNDWIQIVSSLLSIGAIIWWRAIVYYVINHSKYEKWLSGFIKDFSKRFFPVLGTGILYWILSILWLMLFIIPWVIFGIYWYVATSISMDEKVWWWSALKKSKQLIKGRRWQVFWVNLGLGIVIWLMTIISGYSIYLWYVSIGWNPIIDLLWNTVQYLIVIFMSVFSGLLYLHLKSTVTQWDTNVISENDTNESQSVMTT